MLTKIDDLCAERDRLKKERPGHNRGKVFGGRQVRYLDDEANPTPFLRR